MPRRTLAAALLLALPAPLWAGGDAYQKAEFAAGGKTLRYRVLTPEKIEQGKTYPLVLFLHGAGERGADNERQLVHGSGLFTQKENRAKYPCFVIFPQCPEGKAWAEVDWGAKTPHTMPAEPSEPLRLTRELLAKFVKDNPVDAARVYVMGLSMGGFGTWDFAARYPDVPAAVVPICGGADDATAPKLKGIGVWAFHGAKDTVVWPQRSRSMVAALKKAGHKDVRYTEYPDVGHNSWDPAFREEALLPWLFAHRRPAGDKSSSVEPREGRLRIAPRFNAGSPRRCND